MLPLAIEVKSQKVVVVARGRPGQQRYDLVRAAGCERIALYAIDQDGWACNAEALLHERLPDPKEFEGARLVFIAGLPRDAWGSSSTSKTSWTCVTSTCLRS